MKMPRMFRAVDVRDAHVYLGLAIAGAGGWTMSPAWTLVALGIVLTLMGVFVPRRGTP